MDAPTTALIATALLLLLLAVRTPVALALLTAGVVGLWLLDGFDLAQVTLSRRGFESVGRYVLVVVPLFLGMGVLVKESGLGANLFTFGARLFRRTPAGLVIATVFACSVFAAVCGSSVATVAAIGRIAVREMRRVGYDIKIALGAVGAAGTLGVLIPPSIVLVLYGIITGESIGALLIAGIVPGILTALIYMLGILVRARLRPSLFRVSSQSTDDEGRDESSDGASAYPPVRGLIEAGSLALLVMGSLYTGIATVVESAALGAVGALIVLLLRRRTASRLSRLRSALLGTTELNAMIFLLLVGSGVFSYFLVTAGIPREAVALISQVDLSPGLVVVVILLVFVPLGMFLDPISMILIAVPLAYPVVVGALDFNGIWFGILVVKMTELAAITPPLGLNAYVVAGVADDVSVDQAFAAVAWYIPLDVLTIAVLFIFPEISTWLPGLMQ